MDWTNEMVMEFLDLYKREQIMWNPSHPDYKDRTLVNNAWKNLQNDMTQHMPITELKRKRDSLMASFRRAKKVKSGTWFAFEKMASFLMDNDKSRSTLDSADRENGFGLVYEEIQEDISNTNIQNGSGDGERMAPKKKRNMKGKNELRRRTDHAYHAVQSVTQKPEEGRNICDIYGELVAARMKTMSENTREVCMNRIDNVLFEMKQIDTQK